ncbi:unnamed protein product [Effrenium voratum]|uniref:Protein kinase domain-containing protein n=1 Tax=Effrenium voratum TaxID=2562239 RepID=A0AA36J2P3_9DINO|nr:unnamed protein product [Effrenium voratum]
MNNYQLYEEIGHGKFSKVYKGRKKFTIQFVAVKSIEKCRRDRVMTEVGILSNLQHENVLEFVHWYETRNHLWVIFEYCAGGDLLRLLKQDGRLPEERVRVFGQQICAGLLHVHSRGVIFADLKPANILFTEEEVLKLSDFGCSVRLEEAKEARPARRGAPQYMAPELFSEGGTVSFASDLWSLGCLLQELFSGSPPFSSPNSQQLQILILTEAAPSLPTASTEFQDLVGQLLRKRLPRLTWPVLRCHRWWRQVVGADADVQVLQREPPLKSFRTA